MLSHLHISMLTRESIKPYNAVMANLVIVLKYGNKLKPVYGYIACHI